MERKKGADRQLGDPPNDPLEMIDFEGRDTTLGRELGARYIDTIGEAALFILSGYGHISEYLRVGKAKGLNPYLDEGLEAAQVWQDSCPGRHWNAIGPLQTRKAMDEHPMCLPKALVMSKVLEVAAADLAKRRRLRAPDVWSTLRIMPAIYFVEGFTEEFLRSISEESLESFKNDVVLNLRDGRSRNLLNDLAKGQHVTFEIAQAVIKHLGTNNTLQLKSAVRRGQSGLPPASSALVFAPRPLVFLQEIA